MDSSDKQDLFQKTLYTYMGYQNIEAINDDIGGNIEEIKLTEVPESLDKWFLEFNDSLEKQDKKIKNANKFKKVLSKVSIAFLVLFISFATLTASVDAFRIRVLNLIVENTDRYLAIEVSDEAPVEAKNDNLPGNYILAYIPNGFEIDFVEDFGKTHIVNYINKENEEILFNQSPNGTDFQMDSEDASIRDVDIMGDKAIILNKEGRTTLFWHNEEYSFYLLSTWEESELIKMAKSLKLK